METFKVILVGEPGVGKTQLLRTFSGEKFSDVHNPTRGVECTPVVMCVEGKEVTLQLWDTAIWWCQDRFRPVTTKQYQEAHAVIYVYDSTNFQTLSGLRAAFDEVVRCNSKCVKILVGTKYDLKPKNLINKPINQGQVLATTLSLPYFEVSAKVAPPGPDTAFFSLAATLLSTAFEKRNYLDTSLSLQALAISEEKLEQDATSTSSSAQPQLLESNGATETTTSSYNAAAAAFQGVSYAEPMETKALATKPSYVAAAPKPAYVAPSPFGPAVTSYVIPTRYVPPTSSADPFGLSAPAFDHLYNVVLLGDAKVGKTQLLRSFLEEDFSETYVASSAVNSCSKIFDVEGRKVKLQMWDVPRGDQAEGLEALRTAHGVLVLYDMTELKTFEACRAQFDRVQKGCSENVRVILVGNKTDLQDKTVDYNVAKSFADEQKVPFFEISARASFNVETTFRALVKAIRMIPAYR